jgi:hypothetical protein
MDRANRIDAGWPQQENLPVLPISTATFRQ